MKKYFKPQKGMIVRDPRDGKPLPTYGASVPNTSYWRRRFKDGDVEETTPAAIRKAEEAVAKAAETIKEQK